MNPPLLVMITTNNKLHCHVKLNSAFFTCLHLIFFSHHKSLRSPRNFLMITIDEFRKIELKVATVKSAEPHPNADRLMVLNVDLGSEERQICAGIRNHYTPEELVG